ncbi:hypothetical protein ACFQ41_13230 [Lacticaseibacillus suilingensis]|uniref:Uncharacterized protein n=1 Tax=Lacticaseibacillus suilingensis TaxID=2799577 RepID=A0ABW4BID2_9LACO
MTAHKYYKRGLVTAEQFDGSKEMAKRWRLLADGPRWYTGDTIMDFLVKRGMWIIGMPRKYLSQQIITDEAFHRLYAPLPVIPKAVGEYIECAQDNELSLVDAMRWHMMPDWALDNSDTFALAWLQGEWEEV